MLTMIFGMMAVFLVFHLISSFAYEAFQGPSELIQYDPSKAFKGYTLFSPFRSNHTYLIDMEGNVVHMWAYPEGWGTPGEEAIEKHARLLEDGTLIRGAVNRTAGNRGATYQILDWDGNVKWEYTDNRKDRMAHHDFRLTWNPKLQAKTLMFVSGKDISHEEAVAMGCDPNLKDDYTTHPDGIVEVDMDGNIIWEWNITDHLIQDINPDLPNYVEKGKTISDYPGKLDPNFGGGRRGDWIHINSFDHNETLDQIVINNSIDSEFYVIDHGATFISGDPKGSIDSAAGEAGDFVYRWGNPCIYDSGDCPSLKNEGQEASNGHQQVFFSHDVQWVREKETTPMKWELPGAGNFMIFDNGTRRPGGTYSSVLEINPYDGDWKNGKYIPQMDAGHNEFGASDQITWCFRSAMPNAFFGHYISGCQRLPNGNTLIDSGPSGHFFEVTVDGEVVWEYINPVGDRTKGEYGIYKIMNDATKGTFNATFRCHRYGIDYPGLQGKVLTPKGKITEIHSNESARPSITVPPKVPLGATPGSFRPPRPGGRPGGPPGPRPGK
ncbi:aryl-sulfate sulfotransferase [Thermodesulfobacteriota bacterium]